MSKCTVLNVNINIYRIMKTLLMKQMFYLRWNMWFSFAGNMPPCVLNGWFICLIAPHYPELIWHWWHVIILLLPGQQLHKWIIIILIIKSIIVSSVIMGQWCLKYVSMMMMSTYHRVRLLSHLILQPFYAGMLRKVKLLVCEMQLS